MDFHKLVNKLYEIEPSDVRHIDINALKPVKSIDIVGPDLVNESHAVTKGSLKEGIPSDLASFLKLSGASSGRIIENDKPVAPKSAPVNEQRDTISLDVPLLIRLLEYAREDANSDVDLHNVAEKLVELTDSGKVLTMQDYDSIVDIPTTEDKDPCWKNYQQVGTKKKGNKQVPNCVPKTESIADYLKKAYEQYELRESKNGRISKRT